jgi:hypothetical protein
MILYDEELAILLQIVNVLIINENVEVAREGNLSSSDMMKDLKSLFRTLRHPL